MLGQKRFYSIYYQLLPTFLLYYKSKNSNKKIVQSLFHRNIEDN